MTHVPPTDSELAEMEERTDLITSEQNEDHICANCGNPYELDGEPTALCHPCAQDTLLVLASEDLPRLVAEVRRLKEDIRAAFNTIGAARGETHAILEATLRGERYRP
jgi:hypothetical protein